MRTVITISIDTNTDKCWIAEQGAEPVAYDISEDRDREIYLDDKITDALRNYMYHKNIFALNRKVTAVYDDIADILKKTPSDYIYFRNEIRADMQKLKETIERFYE